MTESLTSPKESESTINRDTTLLEPVSPVEAAWAAQQNPVTPTSLQKKKKIPFKSIAVIAAGAVATVVVYRHIDRPIPKTEKLARKVRRAVWHLEEHHVNLNLPPHVRHKVQHGTAVTAKTAKATAVFVGRHASVAAKTTAGLSKIAAKKAKTRLKAHT